MFKTLGLPAPGVAVGLVAVFLAGCGGGGGDDSDETSADGGWQLDPPVIDLSGSVGLDPVAGTILLRNNSRSSLSFSVSSDASWLSVSPEQDIASANTAATLTLTAHCEHPGTHIGRVRVTVDGQTQTAVADLTCSMPEVIISNPHLSHSITTGWPHTPAETRLSFTLSSEWATRREIRYSVHVTGLDGVTAEPLSGKADVGEGVLVKLSAQCAAIETLDGEVTVRAEDADDVSLPWTVDCIGGNPVVVRVETFQGPALQLFDFTGDSASATSPRIETMSRPVAGRPVAVVAHLTHSLEEPPELAAWLSPDPAPDNRDQWHALEVARPFEPASAQDTESALFTSEIVFTVSRGFFGVGRALQLEIDPHERLPELDETDNLLTIRATALSKNILRQPGRQILVRRVARTLSYNEALAGRLPSNTLVTPEPLDEDVVAARIVDFLPVGQPAATAFVQNAPVAMPDPAPFTWEPALIAFEFHRLLTAATKMQTYIGIVQRPDLLGATEQDMGVPAFCGIAYVGGRSALTSELNDPSCGHRALAHELGHTMGLLNVDGGCGSQGHDVSYPYRAGLLGPQRIWRFSRNEFVSGPEIVDGGETADRDEAPYRDIMTHCTPAFASDYSYNKALGFLGRASSGYRDPPSPLRRKAGTALMAGCGAQSLVLLGTLSPEGMPSLYGTGYSQEAEPIGLDTIASTLSLSLLDENGSDIVAIPLATQQSIGGTTVWFARVPIATGIRPVRAVIADAQGIALDVALDPPPACENSVSDS